jgi:hypothetical protein
MRQQQNQSFNWRNLPGWAYFLIAVGVLYLLIKFSEIYNPIRNKSADFTISSYELARDYDENVAAAKSKYDGKIVSVSGYVTMINEDWIVIDNDITCQFSDNKGLESIRSLRKGSQVSVKGQVNGTTLGGNVQLDNCVMSSGSGNTTSYRSGDDRTCNECGTSFKQDEGWACRLDPDCYAATKNAPIEYIKYCTSNCANNSGMKLRNRNCL